jgi:hypothetical protein
MERIPNRCSVFHARLKVASVGCSEPPFKVEKNEADEQARKLFQRLFQLPDDRPISPVTTNAVAQLVKHAKH